MSLEKVHESEMSKYKDESIMMKHSVETKDREQTRKKN